MGKLRIQTEDGQTSSGWANQEDATTRKRPPWAAGSTVRGGVPKVHPKGAGPGRGFPARDGPPEGRTAQWGLKPCSRFSCYFFQKKKKSQKTFRIRGSPIRKWLFPNRTPSVSLSLWFLLAISFIFFTLRDASESRVFQPIHQRKEAIQHCWSKPRATSFRVRSKGMRSEPS